MQGNPPRSRPITENMARTANAQPHTAEPRGLLTDEAYLRKKREAIRRATTYGEDNFQPAGLLLRTGYDHGISDREPRVGGLSLRQRSRAFQCDYRNWAQRVPPSLTLPLTSRIRIVR